MNVIGQNKTTIKHIHMLRMEDGLIVEYWAARNDVGMAGRLSLLPEAAMSTAG